MQGSLTIPRFRVWLPITAGSAIFTTLCSRQVLKKQQLVSYFATFSTSKKGYFPSGVW